MTPARTLVIAEAFGYNVEVYRVFLLSLRQSGYRGDVSLLAPPNRTRPDAAALLRRHGVSLVVERRSPARHNADRFETYAQLCSVRSPYRYCLAADFRDVVFQSDPFQELLQTTLLQRQHGADVGRSAADGSGADGSGDERRGAWLPDLILPLERRVVGTDPINRKVLHDCFGAAAAERLANRTVVCSGVLLGTPAAFEALPRLLVPLAHRCRLDKMSDQAALNVLAYSTAREASALLLLPGLLPRSQHVHAAAAAHRRGKEAEQQRPPSERGRPEEEQEAAAGEPALGRGLRVELQPAGAGLANTIGVFKGRESALAFERERMRHGLVLNEDRRPSPIVHQYDRVLESTGPRGRFGRTSALLHFRAVDRALAGEGHAVPNHTAWLPQF